MKIMVVFHLPDGDGLLYCQLTDLALAPAVRSIYPYNGTLYQVERVLEVIQRKLDGKRKSTSEQLLELLGAIKTLSPAENIDVAELAKMTNVGEPEDGLEKTAGGVILAAATALVKESDRLVVLKMSSLGPVVKADENTLLALLTKAQHLSAASPKAAETQS